MSKVQVTHVNIKIHVSKNIIYDIVYSNYLPGRLVKYKNWTSKRGPMDLACIDVKEIEVYWYLIMQYMRGPEKHESRSAGPQIVVK